MKVAEPFHLHGQMSDSFRAADGQHCFFEHGVVPEGLAERGEVPYPGGIVFDRYSGRGADTHSF